MRTTQLLLGNPPTYSQGMNDLKIARCFSGQTSSACSVDISRCTVTLPYGILPMLICPRLRRFHSGTPSFRSGGGIEMVLSDVARLWPPSWLTAAEPFSKTWSPRSGLFTALVGLWTCRRFCSGIPTIPNVSGLYRHVCCNPSLLFRPGID